MASFDGWTEALRGMVESIGPTLKSDEDWQPVLFVQNYRGESVVAALVFDSEDAKDQIAEWVGQTIVQNFGVRAGMVLTAWMVKMSGGQMPEQPPSEHPDRQEAVVFYTLDLDRTRYMMAMIERHENAPPTLGPWEEYDDTLGVAGRFIDAMRWALTVVRDLAEDPARVLKMLAERIGDDDEAQTVMEALADMAEADPELAKSMPIARWRASGADPGGR